MRVLLTGATGFVGKHILKELRSLGCTVTVTMRPDQVPPEDVEVIRSADIFSETVEFWEVCCRDIDRVIHSAWYVEHGKYLDSELNLRCIEGTLRLFSGAQSAGVKHFQGIGSCMEYDLYSEELMRKVPIGTKSPLNPTTIYGAAKAATYLAISRFGGGIEVAWSRLFYLFGEGENKARLVPYLRSHFEAGEAVKLTNGHVWRDYLDVEEAASQIAHVTIAGISGPINICSGKAITIFEFATEIAKQYGKENLLEMESASPKETEPFFIVGVPTIRITNEP